MNSRKCLKNIRIIRNHGMKYVASSRKCLKNIRNIRNMNYVVSSTKYLKNIRNNDDASKEEAKRIEGVFVQVFMEIDHELRRKRGGA